MSFGGQCSKMLRKLLTGAAKYITLTHIPRKFISGGSFQWKSLLGPEVNSSALGNRNGYGSNGAWGFSSSQAIKMQIRVGQRPQTDLWHSLTNSSTHIHLLSSLPCAPGLPPYPIQTPTWGRKGETGWVQPLEVLEMWLVLETATWNGHNTPREVSVSQCFLKESMT